MRVPASHFAELVNKESPSAPAGGAFCALEPRSQHRRKSPLKLDAVRLHLHALNQGAQRLIDLCAALASHRLAKRRHMLTVEIRQPGTQGRGLDHFTRALELGLQPRTRTGTRIPARSEFGSVRSVRPRRRATRTERPSVACARSTRPRRSWSSESSGTMRRDSRSSALRTPSTRGCRVRAAVLGRPRRINGDRRQGTGILNNELYAGPLVWNRQRWLSTRSGSQPLMMIS